MKNNLIITNLKGGLGNQMFQYATGLAISIKNNVKMKLDITGYSNPKYINSDTPRTFDLKDFRITKEIATNKEIEKIKYPLKIISKAWRLFRTKILRKNYQDYHPKIFAKKNYYLDGFWQSEKNFEEIRDIILKEFTLKNESIEYINAKNKISNNSFSIHIRHGDYLNDAKTFKYHGVLDLEYYQKSYLFIKEKKQIDQVIIFTDDAQWAKENFDFVSEPKIYASDFNLSVPEELILMSKCSHNIIANSSFSWWGAWLNQNPEKIVIAPQKWLNTDISKQPDIIAKTWIKI